MKPILVPIDFSEPAENAARYAVNISKVIKSNICLCNSFLVPSDAIGSGQVAWPLYEYSTLAEVNTTQLDKLARKLEIKDKAITGLSSFHPDVFCSAVAGNTTDVLSELVEEKKAGLIIMGMSGAGSLSRFFLGSVSRQTIERADCPILLVPAKYKFRDIKKIALATDLSKGDLNVIHSIAAFAALFGADLIITNVTDEYQDTPDNSKKSEAFQKGLLKETNYDKIYYRQVKNAEVNEGLDFIIDKGDIDILVMIHHQKGLLSRLLGGSYTKQLAGHIPIPLLVVPFGKDFTF